MKPEALEWVKKAEGDFASCQRECRARKSPNYDAACFHAQQCAEKYLKAWLQESGKSVPHTHDLVRLLGLMSPCVALEGMKERLSILTAYAAEFRYPGESATREAAKEALGHCLAVRRELRYVLLLDDA